MAKFIIEGQQKLKGSIEVLGAKNAALIIITACCLLEGETTLENVPNILDIQKIINILEKMGVKFTRYHHQLKIDTTNLRKENPNPKLVGAIRASIVLVGPLLARFDQLNIPHPGGCTIGSRPIDLHIWALKQLGVAVKEVGKTYEFLKVKDLTKPVTITFPKISVGATENTILYACMQEQEIKIKNAAIEPEIIDLIDFLRKTGIKIKVASRTITINGQKQLKAVSHTIIPDRIEAGTFMILSAITKNPLKITGIRPDHLKILFEKFKEIGVDFDLGEDFAYIKKSEKILPTEISTAEYPGFPTDLQPPFGVLLTQAEGKSYIKENLFENRMGYLAELTKMGAKIELLSSTKAEITGLTPLKSAKIHSLDLRAGATLLIAALIASGTTEILQAENIDRGYEKIEERLKAIGSKIKRVK